MKIRFSGFNPSDQIETAYAVQHAMDEIFSMVTFDDEGVITPDSADRLNNWKLKHTMPNCEFGLVSNLSRVDPVDRFDLCGHDNACSSIVGCPDCRMCNAYTGVRTVDEEKNCVAEVLTLSAQGLRGFLRAVSIDRVAYIVQRNKLELQIFVPRDFEV